MKVKLTTLLLCTLVAVVPQLRAKTILPDACGDDKVSFDVKTAKDQPPPAPPAKGKAQIIFVETMDKEGLSMGGNPTIRFGLDGAWAGANEGNSYFVVEVEPGVHHVCSDWGKKTGEDSFTAVAGNAYYWESKIIKHTKMVMMNGMGTTSMGAPVNASMSGTHTDKGYVFSLLSDDEGRYRVKLSKLSVSKPKK